MKIQKIINKLKNLTLFHPLKYKEIDGSRFYTIHKHTAKVDFDKEMGLYVGVFQNMRAMTIFYAYYESDIPSFGAQALKSYLAHCKNNGLNPYRE